MVCAISTILKAAKPICQADRHAQKKNSKSGCGVRAIERSVNDATLQPITEVVQDYCQAVRAALTRMVVPFWADATATLVCN